MAKIGGLSLLLAAALAAGGCVSGSKIRADAEVVKQDIARARASNAYKCAPRELALAESNVRFCEDELDQGNWLRANEHVQIALAAAKAALENSKDCAPQEVIVKEPPKVVAIEKTDRDGDGIFDVDDQCPDDPEDKDGFEDQDGCPDLDNDKDGVPDVEDGCPNDPGPPENKGCPVQDRDGDGIKDDIDKCPDVPEDKDGFQDEDGCPDPDNDGDGILDADDKCPNEPEDKDGFQDEDGCPDPDNDGDGIQDFEDKCPNEPGPPDSPQGKGCPRKFTLIKIDREKKRIEIKQQVHFDTGKWKILPDSYGLLNQVVQVLKDFPSMKIEIQGHTDDRGPDDFNQTLSDNRAAAVKEYLIQKGIDPERLRSVGYGETKPIDSNRTARGRAANRRVEFHIIEE
jgi:OOP family OmpA-OmpF porin